LSKLEISYVCEHEFDTPDPRNPEYSMTEYDVYAHIPYRMDTMIDNHRLTLRKNLKTGQFEVYRHYLFTVGTRQQGEEEVVFTGSFEDALKFITQEHNKYWGRFTWIQFRACRHVPGAKSPGCEGDRSERP